MRTFIVRLMHDANVGAGQGSRLRGVVDDVTTGLRTTFRSDAELVGVLTAAVAAAAPGPEPGQGDGSAGEVSSDEFGSEP